MKNSGLACPWGWIHHSPFRHGLAALVLIGSIVLISGCGGKSGDNTVKNEVTGKVLMNDKPVAGQVVFVYPDGKELLGPITMDGGYSITEPPAGTVKVCVRPLVSGVAMPKGSVELPKDGPGLGAGGAPPKMYHSAATSGLTYDVKAGKQVHDITLKP